MSELCILQDDVPSFPNQVNLITEPQLLFNLFYAKWLA